MKTLISAAAALFLIAGATHAQETALQDITRSYPGPETPIANMVVVPPGYSTVYLSGMVSDINDPSAAPGSIASYGTTEIQTESILAKIHAQLQFQGLDFKDIVSMHVYLVGDPALGGKMDFAGMMAAYKRHFGTADQPNRPVRATVQVAALAQPGFLVEIEVVAAKKPDPLPAVNQ